MDNRYRHLAALLLPRSRCGIGHCRRSVAGAANGNDRGGHTAANRNGNATRANAVRTAVRATARGNAHCDCRTDIYTRASTTSNGHRLYVKPRCTQTQTRVAGVPKAVPYNIIVPTPTAPPSVYPIKFDSRLKVVTYNVTGKTTKELSQSLNANTLADPHEPGSRYYARTDWYLATNWYVKPTARGCEVDRADVSVAMTMTLPMLPTTTGIALDVLKRWNTFMSNTITHEVGHVEIGLRGGREYQRELGNYPPASNCNALRAKLEALFDSHYAAIDRANVDFDVKTEHGAKQGAVFP